LNFPLPSTFGGQERGAHGLPGTKSDCRELLSAPGTCDSCDPVRSKN
jgi:hypothetical protein